MTRFGPNVLRTATTSDIRGLTLLLGEMDREANVPFEFDPVHVSEELRDMIVSPYGFCICLEMDGRHMGILGARIGETWFSPDIFVSETVFFIHSDFRGDLRIPRAMVDALLTWGRENGAQFAALMSLEGLGKVEVLYRRLGFNRAETRFIKAL